MEPTLEQVAIIEAAKNKTASLMIKAYAGTGKTTTIEMTGRALPVRPSLYVVFNVKNKKEAEKRMPSHFNVKTLNGLGHEAFGRTIGKRLAVGWTMGTVVSGLGVYLSLYLDLPTGATIVCTFGSVLAIMAILKPLLRPARAS